MDAYDCEKIDKAISKRVEEIYSDPKRHVFLSCYDANVYGDIRGPRGGKIRGRKRICAHCGKAEKYHAKVTEEL